MIYKLAKTIIVVSQNTKDFMVNNEHISGEKISVIPLSYDFELYEKPNNDQVNTIRDKFKTDLLLITVGRFTSLKRIERVIDLVKRLHTQGVDVKLLILGDGPEAAHLKKRVTKYSLEEQVTFIGYVTDVLSYIAAADVYIHFSISEASCTTVKEAGIASKPVIVCRGVGDFDEYIEEGVNGWMVSANSCVEESVDILKSIHNTNQLMEMGKRLNLKVLKHFNIKNVVDKYEKIHSA